MHTRRLFSILVLSLGLVLALRWLLGTSLPTARAASFTVTTTADDYDAPATSVPTSGSGGESTCR